MGLKDDTWPSGNTMLGHLSMTLMRPTEKPNGGLGGFGGRRLRGAWSPPELAYNIIADEHCAGLSTGARTSLPNQSMNSVLLRMAWASAESGRLSPNAQRASGAGSTNGRRPS